MRIIVAFAALILASHSASAGVCLSDDELDDYVKELEATAASPAKARELGDYWGYCIEGNQPRRARVVKACTKIVARLDVAKRPTPTTQAKDDEEGRAFDTQLQCIQVLAGYGVSPIKTKTKEVDWIGDHLANKFPPHEDPTGDFRTFRNSGDPRVMPRIAELYRQNLAYVAKNPQQGWRGENWLRWHRDALEIVESLGGTSELALLDEVKASTTDKRVLFWVEKARSAIAKR